jgi:hypothetical protein
MIIRDRRQAKKPKPIIWRRVAWFVGFAAAAAVAAWMRSLDYGWLAALGVAVAIWIVLPFVISQLYAAFVLGRAHSRMRGAADLMDKIGDAIKGLPPEEQEAAAKRMIDEAFK